MDFIDYILVFSVPALIVGYVYYKVFSRIMWSVRLQKKAKQLGFLTFFGSDDELHQPLSSLKFFAQGVRQETNACLSGFLHDEHVTIFSYHYFTKKGRSHHPGQPYTGFIWNLPKAHPFFYLENNKGKLNDPQLENTQLTHEHPTDLPDTFRLACDPNYLTALSEPSLIAHLKSHPFLFIAVIETRLVIIAASKLTAEDVEPLMKFAEGLRKSLFKKRITRRR